MNSDTTECSWLSRNKFQELLEHYRSLASPTRRTKVFINQEMYNDIKGVLEDSRYSHQRGNRFGPWVRERFKLTVFANGITIVTLLRDETKMIAVEEQLYNTVTRAHEDCSHGGRDATLHKLKNYIYCPDRFVQLVLNHCSICATTNAPNVTQRAAQAIHASSFLEIVQMDLIDYGGNETPDGLPRYILHIKDHRSKFSWAYSLLRKESSVVGKKLHDLFCLVGPPIFLQSDNGGEFTAQAMKDELQSNWPTLRFINGRPRHPQSQGLIERGNRTLVQKLNAWVSNQNATEEDPKHWSEGLGMVVYAMNTSRTRVLRDTPYRYLYGQDPHPDDTVNQEYIDRPLNGQHVVDGEAVDAIPEMVEVYQSGEGDDESRSQDVANTMLSSQEEDTEPEDDDGGDDGSLDSGEDDDHGDDGNLDFGDDDGSIGFGDDEGGSHASNDTYSNAIVANTATERLQVEEGHGVIDETSSNSESGDTATATFLELRGPGGRGLMTIPIEDADGVRGIYDTSFRSNVRHAYRIGVNGERVPVELDDILNSDDDHGIAPPSPLSLSSTEPLARNEEFDGHANSEHFTSNDDHQDGGSLSDVSINRHSAIRNAAATHYNNNVESIQQQ
ncbi:hypothetical protein O0I10_011541 [Lichtheimia ornata]|uniref:Integrase catalytic domain-containing protein n=2 Tax=Lichtheimia ornata TaxID=688661 RepID=A0AAD7UUD8_9FUNG|nr:uncharacterized protein O0I10_011541 [Lichtheimia ornata]KAJ8652802.1 hypothetical protein O0I10_011541 [Lichtheimia ornata]